VFYDVGEPCAQGRLLLDSWQSIMIQRRERIRYYTESRVSVAQTTINIYMYVVHMYDIDAKPLPDSANTGPALKPICWSNLV
jgi:hypothetical protein